MSGKTDDHLDSVGERLFDCGNVKERRDGELRGGLTPFASRWSSNMICESKIVTAEIPLAQTTAYAVKGSIGRARVASYKHVTGRHLSLIIVLNTILIRLRNPGDVCT